VKSWWMKEENTRWVRMASILFHFHPDLLRERESLYYAFTLVHNIFRWLPILKVWHQNLIFHSWNWKRFIKFAVPSSLGSPDLSKWSCPSWSRTHCSPEILHSEPLWSYRLCLIYFWQNKILGV
jgi:hypothetical protein